GSALAIDGSPAAHVARLRRGVELLRLLDAGHSVNALLRWGHASLGARGALVLLACATAVALASVALASQRRRTRATALAARARAAAAAAVAMAAGWRPPGEPQPLDGLQLAASAVGLSAAALWLARRCTRAEAALAGALALFPFVHAAGSSGATWA